MRIDKPTSVKKTTTRKAVKKAIEIQDAEDLNSTTDIQEAIRLKAYELYVARGCQGGSPEQDWADAERIVLNKKK